MKNLFKQLGRDSWLEARLVWLEGAPKGVQVPDQKEKPKDVLDASNEKVDVVKIAERIKDLNLPESKIGDGKKPATILEFRQALNKSCDGKELNILHLDLVLMQGLLENIGAADEKPSKISAEEGKALSNWLKKNQVVSFKIVNGFWEFTANNGPVKADYKLDNDDVKDAKSSEKVGATSVEKAVLSKTVKKVKEADIAKSESDKKAAEADADRKKPENLVEVSSAHSVDLLPKMKLEDLSKNLEFSVSKKITAAEIEKALRSYADGLDGKTPDEKYEKFIKRLVDEKYTKIEIRLGKLVFFRGNEANSNPLGFSKAAGNGKAELVSSIAWAHENLAKNADKKKGEVEKKELDGKALQNFSLNKTENEVAKLLTGKEQVEQKDLAKVDARYLPAMEKILDYKNGEPVKITIPFNDEPLQCSFSRSPQGTYIIRWSDSGFYEYNPKDSTPEGGLKEAKMRILKEMSDGSILQRLQNNNIHAPFSFTKCGMKIDNGPIDVPGGVKYEFDWNTGALGDDPDVVITTMPHGELAVAIEQRDLPNGKRHEFIAGGFQDMVRILEGFRKYAEAPGDKKAEMKADMDEQAFFDQGHWGLQKMIGSADVGQILRVNSVRDSKDQANPVDLKNGYKLDFDWMQKLPNPQALVIKKYGNEYSLNWQPSNQYLGKVESPMNALNFEKAMKIVENQKKLLTLQEGQNMMKSQVKQLVDDYNKLVQTLSKSVPVNSGGIEMGGGVKVVSISEGVVYLSLGDSMQPRGFNLGKMEGGKLVADSAGMQQALKEGYFVSKDRAELDSNLPSEKTEVAPAEPASKISVELSGNTVPNTFNYIERLKVDKSAVDSLLKKEEVIDSGSPLEKLPKTKAYLAWVIKSRDELNYVERGFVDESAGKDISEAKNAYAVAIKDVLKKFFENQDNQKKPGELTVSYEKRVLKALALLIKPPAVFMKEYAANLKIKTAYDKYVAEKAALVTKQKEVAEAKTNPHLMSFDEYSKKLFSGFGGEAYRIMAQTEGVKLADVNLSRVEGNSPNSENRVSFNVQAGKIGNQVPLTISIYRENGFPMVAVAEGWNNNVDKKFSLSAAGKDPVKDVIDGYLAGNQVRRMNIQEQVKAEKKS